MMKSSINASFPFAYKVAILAPVPVPQGDLSSAAVHGVAGNFRYADNKHFSMLVTGMKINCTWSLHARHGMQQLLYLELLLHYLQSLLETLERVLRYRMFLPIA